MTKQKKMLKELLIKKDIPPEEKQQIIDELRSIVKKYI